MKVIDIAKGHVNELFGWQEELYEKRIAICRQCPEMVVCAQGETCMVCSCRLAAKTRVPESFCIRHKWEAEKINKK